MDSMIGKELSDLTEDAMESMHLSEKEKGFVRIGGTLTGVGSGILATTDEEVLEESAHAGFEIKQAGSLQVIELKP